MAEPIQQELLADRARDGREEGHDGGFGSGGAGSLATGGSYAYRRGERVSICVVGMRWTSARCRSLASRSMRWTLSFAAWLQSSGDCDGGRGSAALRSGWANSLGERKGVKDEAKGAWRPAR
jgi:hypothetical protein